MPSRGTLGFVTILSLTGDVMAIVDAGVHKIASIVVEPSLVSAFTDTLPKLKSSAATTMKDLVALTM